MNSGILMVMWLLMLVQIVLLVMDPTNRVVWFFAGVSAAYTLNSTVDAVFYRR